VTDLLNTLTIRDFDEDDVPAITSIYKHAVLNGTGTFEIQPPGEAEMKIRQRVMATSNYPYLIAELDRKVVGFAYVNSYRPREAYARTVENSIYIREGFQGKGIGLQLLERLIKETAAGGFRQIIAVIGDSANIGSIRVHEKAGFVHAGVLRDVGFKNGRWLDTVMMQYALPEKS